MRIDVYVAMAYRNSVAIRELRSHKPPRVSSRAKSRDLVFFPASQQGRARQDSVASLQGDTLPSQENTRSLDFARDDTWLQCVMQIDARIKYMICNALP